MGRRLIVVIWGGRILLPPLLLWVRVQRGLAPPTRSGVPGAFGISSFLPHSHRSRRQDQKEKCMHPNAGPARRSAPRSPCCGLWRLCVHESVCTRLWEARLDANGPAGGLEGWGGADGSSKGVRATWRTGSSVRCQMCNRREERTIRQVSLAAGGPGRWRGGEEGILSSYYVYN